MSDLEDAARPSQQAIIKAIEKQTTIIVYEINKQTKVIEATKVNLENGIEATEKQYKKWCKYKKLSTITTFTGISIALAFSIADYVRSGEQSMLFHILKFIRFAIG